MLYVLASLALSQMNPYVNGSVQSPFIDAGQVTTSVVSTHDGGLVVLAPDAGVLGGHSPLGETYGVHLGGNHAAPPPVIVSQSGVVVGYFIVDGGTDVAGLIVGAADGGDLDGGAQIGTALFSIVPGTPYGDGGASWQGQFNCFLEPWGFNTQAVFGNGVVAITDGGGAEAVTVERVGGGIIRGAIFSWEYICLGW